MTIAHKHIQTALGSVPAWAARITVKHVSGLWIIHCYRK